MHSLKRQFLSSRNAMVVEAMSLLLGVATFAYGGDGTSANALRHVRGRTIFSEESPKAELSVRKGFRFIGTQQVNLYGNAEAEQYLFARSGPDEIVKRFYWIPGARAQGNFVPNWAIPYPARPHHSEQGSSILRRRFAVDNH